MVTVWQITENKKSGLPLYDKGAVSVSGSMYINGRDLTTEEFRKVVSRVKRGIPLMLENVPFSDFGTDNIKITNTRRS